MESESADRDDMVQSPERNTSTTKSNDKETRNESIARPRREEEPTQGDNQVYRDTEYAIGGCNNFGSFVPDTDKHTNPPPQYEMTYDERDRYPVYLHQTDDQCLQQQQQLRANAYSYVTERNKSHMNKVRMNLEPAFISAETQTYGNPDSVGPFIRNTYGFEQQTGCQPMGIRQYGGQIFQDARGFFQDRPQFSANQMGFWREVIDQGVPEKILFSSYGEGFRAPEVNHIDPLQRYHTQVKQTLDNNNRIPVPPPMRAYPESYHTQTHTVTGRPDPGHLRREYMNSRRCWG